MKLEKQLVNLELSQKIKDLGVKQESLFYWIQDMGGEYFLGTKKQMESHKVLRYVQKHYSAFTVAELGEMLPEYIKTWKRMDKFIISRELERPPYITVEKTEADARAKMLIYLLENNLINN